MGRGTRITVMLCGSGLLAVAPSQAQHGSTQLAVTATVVSRCEGVTGTTSATGVPTARVDCGDLPYRVTVTPADGGAAAARASAGSGAAASTGTTRIVPGPSPGVIWVTVEF